MEFSSIRELLSPFVPAAELDDPLIAAIQTHLDLLLRWNEKMNLTAVRTPEGIIERHFGESLFAARQLLARDATLSCIDVGSGAGFPGLPMKYWAPGLRLRLIESHGKKATFLREVGRALALDGVEALGLRAEAVTEKAELVAMRAVERFEQSLKAAAALVAPGGRLAMLIGEGQCERALELLPSGWSERIELPSSERRVLMVFHVEQ